MHHLSKALAKRGGMNLKEKIFIDFQYLYFMSLWKFIGRILFNQSLTIN